MGSFPFVVDTVMESSILRNSITYRRPKFTLLANRPRRLSYFGDISVCSFGGARALISEDNGRFALCVRCCREQKWRIKSVNTNSEDTSKGEAESGDESSDALQATIEKSEKVLAVQKELLLQIAERRNLVSSIKNSIFETEGYELLDEEENGSNLSRNSAPKLNDNRNDIYERDTLPTGPIPSTVGSLEENPPSSISKDLVEGLNGSGKDQPRSGTLSRTWKTAAPKKVQPNELLLKSPTSASIISSPTNGMEVESQHQLEDTSKVKVQLGSPSLLSKETSSPSLEEETHEDTKGSTSIDAKDPTGEDTKPPPLAGANVMNIILVAAECAPWSKTGGLGDVAGALPKALARRGHRVMVVVPRYGNYAEPRHTGVRRTYNIDGQDMEVNYFQAFIDGVDFVFIDSPIFQHIENNIYGGNRVDILKRMALFCKASVEVPWHVPCGGVCYGDGNLVFIANDWHTALLPVYLKAYYRDNGLMKYTRSVLVIHNIAHQGRGPVEDFSYVDLPPHYLDLFRMYDPLGGEHFNIFAAGLKTADRVVTVSHGYSWELKTSEGGWGLHGIINESDWKLRGIVNGIDTNEWSPESDIHLKSDGYTNYSLDTLQTGKSQCKAALQRELGLPIHDDVPLIGFIGRLDPQKGVDLIGEAVPWMMGQDVQLVMLGTGRPDLEQMLRQFENQHRDKIRGWVGFSVKTAHRITAGADILLMPSRFEPCGLNQLYAMRYGTIPVVHAVGGLRDTVQPFDPFNESGLGWTFDKAEANRLIHALGNCLLTYREYKRSWEGLQRRGMMQDLSWDNAAQNYEEVFLAAKYQW